MRLPSAYQANVFLAPLKHRTTSFVVDGRGSNLSLASYMLNSLAVANRRTLILDTDAFYASNVTRFTEGWKNYKTVSTSIRILKHNSDVETWLIRSLFTETEVLIMDDMNTIYHLLSMQDTRLSGRRLQILMGMLSYIARRNNLSVINVVYKNKGDTRISGTNKSLSRFSDLTISVETRDFTLKFDCKHGRAWNNNTFTVRL